MRGKASSSRRKKRRVPEEAEEDEEEGVVLSLSTTSGGTTTTSDDDDDEEEEDVQKTKKKRRGKHPSRETIKCAFEQLCAAGKTEEDRKQHHHSEKKYDDEKKAGRGGKGGVMKGFSIQNLLEMCVKFGYQNWTVLDVENMIRAYELSEAKGEIIRINNHLDSKQNKEDVLLEVTEKGFREIVRKCGVREL